MENRTCDTAVVVLERVARVEPLVLAIIFAEDAKIVFDLLTDGSRQVWQGSRRIFNAKWNPAKSVAKETARSDSHVIAGH